MKASCSLWSADLLALKSAIEALSGHADEFHLDVMDGNCVPDILFGLDFVAAIRAVTSTPLDVHLMTRTTADWIERTVAAGAARLAIHADFCEDVKAALHQIEGLGATPVLVLPLEVAIEERSLPWGFFRRVLLDGHRDWDQRRWAGSSHRRADPVRLWNFGQSSAWTSRFLSTAAFAAKRCRYWPARAPTASCPDRWC